MEQLWTASMTLATQQGRNSQQRCDKRQGHRAHWYATAAGCLLLGRAPPNGSPGSRQCPGRLQGSREPQWRAESTTTLPGFVKQGDRAHAAISKYVEQRALCKLAVLTQEQMGINLLELSSHARNERGLHTSEEQNKTAKANFKGETWSLIGKTKAWGHQWHWNCFRRLRCLLQCSASRQDHQHLSSRTSDLSSDPATQSVTDNVSYWPLSGTIIACSRWYYHTYTQRYFLTTRHKVQSSGLGRVGRWGTQVTLPSSSHLKDAELKARKRCDNKTDCWAPWTSFQQDSSS